MGLRFSNLVVGGILLYKKCLVAAGLRRQRDGWRTTCSIALRSEGSKFILSSFGLEFLDPQIPVDNPSLPVRVLAQLLADFFAQEPVAAIALQSGPDATSVRDHSQPPWVILAQYSSNGDVTEFSIFAPAGAQDTTLSDEQHGLAHKLILRVMNRTRSLGDFSWAARFDERLAKLLAQDERLRGHAKIVLPYIRRILSSVWLSVLEPGPGAQMERHRFQPPDFTHRRPGGPTLLNIVARLTPDRRAVDLWVQVHHAGTDGLPIQEMLNRLEKSWGRRGPVLFPDESQSQAVEHTQTSSVAGHRGVEQLVAFIDFSPLLHWRKIIVDSWTHNGPSEFPISAAILWALSRQSAFARTRFAVAVEVPEDTAHQESRSVNFVVTRPHDFRRDAADENEGLLAFVKDFNQQVDQTRHRTSPVYRVMSTLALLAPHRIAGILRANPEQTRRNYGTLGLSILRDASIFVAPMSDIGFDDGFMAIGSMKLPTASGQSVGCFTVKGPPATIGPYAKLLRHALEELANANLHSAATQT